MVPGYREASQLGAGRTGRVFLATYEPTGAYVAIKYLNATLRRDTEFMDRFRADIHRLVEIHQPHVVRLHEYVETATRAAVVTELVDGVSLRTLLAEHGRVSPEAALTLLKGTLLALAAAHAKGLAHRDVQPGNVLVQADGTVKVTDFGIAVHAEEPGVPAGTPAYMSPELWTQARAGPAADVYAAACVLFEAVTSHPPYRSHQGDEDILTLRDRHLVEPIPLELVPDALRDLLRRGLAKDPAARYDSAERFAACLDEDATAAYGPDWEQRGRRHLAEAATLLALRFPLAVQEEPGPLRVRVPRLPPQLWLAVAAVFVALVAIMVSGGRMPPSAGTILMPPPKAQDDPAPATTPPAPTRTADATPRPSPPPPLPSTPRPTETRPAGTASPRLAVRSLAVARWTGTSGTIAITATGTGRVRLRITYTRRDGEDGVARVVRRETRTLRGDTTYAAGVRHVPGTVACGTRMYAGMLIVTEPAAPGGPRVSEAALDGPACPTTEPAPSSPASED